ncbi:hypothetical protein [Butyricimonas faecihominis]|jgi:hypothetical protein|uniref:hypothetical protein n=1 Tax=Butyricimonas faecihominis TaxID=1472416 RepID=UPI00266F5822|nr:hypothetical protein [Butyricimonas faecihominis]
MKSNDISTMVKSQDEPRQSYYLKFGRKTIHGLSPEDLKSLHDTINEYFDREDEAFPASIYLGPGLGQFSKIQKITSFDNGSFNVRYNVSTFGEIIQYISALQLLDLFLNMLSFLQQVEGIDIQCSIPKIKPRKIKPAPTRKNNRHILLLEENKALKKMEIIKEIPMIVKNETLTKTNVAPPIEYDVQINDQFLDNLSRDQVIEIQHIIDGFLQARV